MAKLEQYRRDGWPLYVMDLRNAEDYAKGHYAGAVNFPGDSWMRTCNALPRDRLLVLYCYHGGNSMRAARQLSRMGYQAVSLYGGYRDG